MSTLEHSCTTGEHINENEKELRIVEKSVTRTLRLETSLDEELTRRAKHEHVSVNFLVSKCLQKYVEWDIPSVEFGMVSVSRDLLRKPFGDLDDQKIERYGRENARNYFKVVTEILRGEFTEATAIEVIRRVGVHGKRYEFNVEEAENDHFRRLVVRHDDGFPMSKFYAAMADELFHVLLRKETKISTTNSLCVVVIET